MAERLALQAVLAVLAGYQQYSFVEATNDGNLGLLLLLLLLLRRLLLWLLLLLVGVLRLLALWRRSGARLLRARLWPASCSRLLST